MDAVTIEFAPATGTEKEWNEAYARLADYFRSYRLHNRIRRTQLILTTLRLASEAHKKDPKRLPTEHAIEQARHLMKEWLGEIYEDLQMTDTQIEATGRLGFFLSGGPDRWPHFFLDKNTMPQDMAEAMRSSVRESGPGLQISKMTPRAIDLGLMSEVAEEGLDRFGRHPVIRYSVLVLLIGTVLGYLYKLLQ
jgi:hypothetical protein